MKFEDMKKANPTNNGRMYNCEFAEIVSAATGMKFDKHDASHSRNYFGYNKTDSEQIKLTIEHIRTTGHYPRNRREEVSVASMENASIIKEFCECVFEVEQASKKLGDSARGIMLELRKHVKGI